MGIEFNDSEKEKMIEKIVNEIIEPSILSDIFQRQPSTIKGRLKDKFNITI